MSFKPPNVKLLKLIVHQKNFSGEDLIINPKDFPTIKKGDIVEIYHPEDEKNSRLLLQVTSFKEDLQGRETISIEQSIASAFQLRTYADVCMNIVSAEDVALDSVELTFKDQYLGRSDMWRLKNTMVNTCVYLNKKIEYCGGSIRCQVYEMWSFGERVACGVINEDTKVIFRSSTSMVYLFLQMSSEMWDFDIHGDLYFEKAVNGFLTDLVQKWKKAGSNHEVTIVLFSRTFYKASSLEEFPLYMRECLQQDYKGRFYEDFYRVAIQNERYDDWTSTIQFLRKLFPIYQQQVLEYHVRPGVAIPKAYNSTASQGNFLEVLNMSLNVFEKHYLDRSFDRTGQLSIVVTPGVGVFEVDRELTNVTKQRVIDNGVGSDLVCVGEQPLHAVPLLKFHTKDVSMNAVDDYSMPHWINLSFYSTNKKVGYSEFIPRIKLPPKLNQTQSRRSSQSVPQTNAKVATEEDQSGLPNALFDYDAYDAKIFQLPNMHTSGRFPHSKKVSTGTMNEPYLSYIYPQISAKRKMSDPDVHHLQSPSPVPGLSRIRSSAISIPSRSIEGSPNNSFHNLQDLKNFARTVQDYSPPNQSRAIIGSVGSQNMINQQVKMRPGRALINPFDPSHVTIKLTSNRRRWTHIFPKGPTGVLIQQHHYQAVPAKSFSDHYDAESDLNKHFGGQNSRNMTLLWGATGEQEWTPALTTAGKVIIGVDWKSLTIPACLPITTDYFPDKRSLTNDYFVSDYDLLPDDVNFSYAQQRAIFKKPLTTVEVFRELISQRLSQGFQLIVLPNTESLGRTARAPSTEVNPPTGNQIANNAGGSLMRSKSRNDKDSEEECLLSIGRLFHKITLTGSTITVTRYRPRHPYHPFNIHYRYRFHAPDHLTYEVSWVSFTSEKLENYNWNYMDHYICTRGDTDFALLEALKFWRFRVYLLPGSHSGTKKILEGNSHFDVYQVQTLDEQALLTDGFIRFVETWVNKIKRPNTFKKTRVLSTLVRCSKFFVNFKLIIADKRCREFPFPRATRQQPSDGETQVEGLHVSPPANRPNDRVVTPRSGSKVMERVKTENTNSGRVSPASEVAFENAETHNVENNEENTNTEFKRLGSTASYQEILEAMKNPNSGLIFLFLNQSLPPMTFSSADAVHWLITHVDGLTTKDAAADVMQGMLKNELIRHASGSKTHPFIVGFYLYYIIGDEKVLGDAISFENEWVEVEIERPLGWKVDNTTPLSPPVASFLADYLDHQDCGEDWKRPNYKHTHLDIDVANKSDRIEWGHAKYQPVFRADRAYEFSVQWVAATGTVVSDLVLGWARKAQPCGLHMIPVPADPFALPYTEKSDPLRGPIFVPLDIEKLMENRSHLFEAFPEEGWKQRLFLLQDAIASRFGFVSCILETPPGQPSRQPPMLGDPVGTPNFSTPTNSSQANPFHRQYIHLTGNAFIMIPTQPCCQPRNGPIRIQTSYGSSRQSRYASLQDLPMSSPHEEYITRHVSGKSSRDDCGSDTRVGFLWSWNHMIGRRWKTASNPATGDENFQNRLLKDFQDFCSNGDNRLKLFWEKCWQDKEKISAVNPVN
ncbi:GATOR complex protein Iml1 isoform X3 [Neocloeon triangulifer]|uniref:GATOR complex protein Iml1 isoform X3 n=1 Tax=Neocloeon triangulifer TaxID=2078957 RepID=UPI00286F726B|nr:GATOR complex protein Iml1 isoform X3 [Neocloeon triangulifer]